MARNHGIAVVILAAISALALMAVIASISWGKHMPIANAHSGDDRPRRIVSLNLCVDQYLVALADPDQIAGLTPNADDPYMSAVSAKTKGLPILGNSAEEILAIDPDLIIGMPARRSGILASLTGRGYKILDIKSARSYSDIQAHIRLIAAAVGHPERGEMLIERMDQKLVAIPKTGNGRVAAYYQRRGYLTGAGTLVDDMMTRIGLVNLATILGQPSLSQIGLEEMTAAQPDFLIIESAATRVTDQGTEMLHHPVINDIPRLNIPQAWTVCGSPAYVDAARSLSEQISRQH